MKHRDASRVDTSFHTSMAMHFVKRYKTNRHCKRLSFDWILWSSIAWATRGLVFGYLYDEGMLYCDFDWFPIWHHYFASILQICQSIRIFMQVTESQSWLSLLDSLVSSGVFACEKVRTNCIHSSRRAKRPWVHRMCICCIIYMRISEFRLASCCVCSLMHVWWYLWYLMYVPD